MKIFFTSNNFCSLLFTYLNLHYIAIINNYVVFPSFSVKKVIIKIAPIRLDVTVSQSYDDSVLN